MKDDERLTMLDRRATEAAAALAEAVQQVPIPQSGLGPPARGIRRFLPIAAAAALAVIALVGAALVSDDADEQGTVAGRPEGVTRLALPDPQSFGYRIVGAFDPSTAPEPPAGLDLTMTVHSPIGADPWESTVVSWAIPADLTTLHGESVDVGGQEATLHTQHGVASVGWIDADHVRYVRSADTTADDLVDIVRRTIDAGLGNGEALPGHEIVHTAPHTDLYPMAAVGATTGDVGGIAYESDRGMLVVATTSGSAARWKVTLALAVDTEQVTVRGRDAVRADFGDGMTEVSWLEADGTLVRVGAYGTEIPIEVLDRLEPLTDAEFAALVAEHGDREATEVVNGDEATDVPTVSGEATGPILPERGASTTTVPDRLPVAEVSTENGDLTVRTTLLRGLNSFDIEIEAEGSSGGSSVGQEIPGPATNVVLRHRVSSEEWTGVVIGGVIGPAVQVVNVIDAETGERLGSASTASIGGSDSGHILFMATLRDVYRDRDLVVVGTTAAGEEVRLDAPA